MDIDFIFSKAAAIIKKHLEENSKREAPVVKFTSPTDLLKVIDLSLPEFPESHDKLLEYVKKVLEYSIQAGGLLNVSGKLGQAKLIYSLSSEPFHKSMREGGHFPGVIFTIHYQKFTFSKKIYN